MQQTHQSSSYIQTIDKFQKKLRVSYRICIFRIVFVAIVFFRQSNFITIKNNKYELWNVMVYILSGTVQIINAIAHGFALQSLTKDRKTLKEQLNRSLKIGTIEAYRNIYSSTFYYKYKNADMSSAFKATQLLHLIITFSLFGHMALMQQFIAQQGFQKQFFLWIFIITAYIQCYQIDYTTFQASNGPSLKVNKFSLGKVYEIYNNFTQWRQSYSKKLSISIIFFIVITVYATSQIVQNGQFPKYFQSSLLIIFFSLTFGFTILASYINMKIIHKAQKGINRLVNHSLANIILYDNLTFFGILERYQNQIFARFFTLHRIICALFFMAWLRTTGDTYQFLILFWLLFISLTYGEYSKISQGITYKHNFLNILNYSDAKKYTLQTNKNNKVQKSASIGIENDQGQNSLRSKTQKQTEQKLAEINQICEQSQQNQQLSNKYAIQICSVCLIQYVLIDKVIILPCGHIFHKICLFDWLKLKKQCPLCRLSLQEYYQK